MTRSGKPLQVTAMTILRLARTCLIKCTQSSPAGSAWLCRRPHSTRCQSLGKPFSMPPQAMLPTMLPGRCLRSPSMRRCPAKDPCHIPRCLWTARQHTIPHTSASLLTMPCLSWRAALQQLTGPLHMHLLRASLSIAASSQARQQRRRADDVAKLW